MLSTVPVPRLLEGVAAALRTHVEPHVTDRFAQMQLRAIDELLRNLAERVDWSPLEVTQEIDDIERLLGALTQAGWTAPDRPGADTERRREDALAELSQALTWIERLPSESEHAAPARSAAMELLRASNARERARLQSGMYS